MMAAGGDGGGRLDAGEVGDGFPEVQSEYEDTEPSPLEPQKAVRFIRSIRCPLTHLRRTITAKPAQIHEQPSANIAFADIEQR